MDAEDSRESTEIDTNITLNLNFLRTIQICAFAKLIFWQFSEKKNRFAHSVWSFRYDICASTTSEKNNNTIFQEKVNPGCFGGNLG